MRVVDDFRTTAGEDFAFIARAVPSCFLFIGSGRDDGTPTYPHHHPSFDIDERSLDIGVAVLVRATRELLTATPHQSRDTGGGHA
jgi:amidohydrolase